MTSAYSAEARDGIYSTSFRHADVDRAFVIDVLSPLLRSMLPGTAVLEVGCGTGDWLQLIGDLLRQVGRPMGDRYGFDLTPEMVEIARERLGDLPADHVRVGDLLRPEAYEFGDGPPFGLTVAYDVVQQLPRRLQVAGIRSIYARVPPGCSLVVFDQDASHPAGRRMGAKKLITRWLRIPLVPRFYLVARYPSVRQLVSALESTGANVEVVRGPVGARIAIVATRPSTR